MKINNTRKNAGMTLIEVTLVIAVLLGLISVLFIGVAAYKKGTDRAKCILSIATVQKAVSSYQNMYDLRNGDALAVATIAGTGKMIETQPNCPDTAAPGTYTYQTTVPDVGIAYVDCDQPEHVPASLAGW